MRPPFGITSLSSTVTSLTLHLDAYMGHKRYSFPEHCLSRLLPAAPAPGSGDDPHGIPGLRMSGIEADGRRLRLHTVKDPGQTATLVLELPKGLTEGWADIERRHRRWCDDNGLRPLWTAPQLDGGESRHLRAYPSLEGSRARRAAVGSGLLRRIALFHTVTAFYRVQCWDDGDSWKVDARTAHPRARWHDQLLQRLCHPRWGLPVRVAHRYCRCAEPDTPISGTTPATSTSTATPPATPTPSTCASTPAPKGTTTTGRSQHCTRSAPRGLDGPCFSRASSSAPRPAPSDGAAAVTDRRATQSGGHRAAGTTTPAPARPAGPPFFSTQRESRPYRASASKTTAASRRSSRHSIAMLATWASPTSWRPALCAAAMPWRSITCAYSTAGMSCQIRTRCFP
ncbi:hypothetical protein NKH18_00555 [Streptomyces sp. M10(2022)]